MTELRFSVWLFNECVIGSHCFSLVYSVVSCYVFWGVSCGRSCMFQAANLH